MIKIKLIKKIYKTNPVYHPNPAETNIRHTKKTIKAPKR